MLGTLRSRYPNAGDYAPWIIIALAALLLTVVAMLLVAGLRLRIADIAGTVYQATFVDRALLAGYAAEAERRAGELIGVHLNGNGVNGLAGQVTPPGADESGAVVTSPAVVLMPGQSFAAGAAAGDAPAPATASSVTSMAVAVPPVVVLGPTPVRVEGVTPVGPAPSAAVPTRTAQSVGGPDATARLQITGPGGSTTGASAGTAASSAAAGTSGSAADAAPVMALSPFSVPVLPPAPAPPPEAPTGAPTTSSGGQGTAVFALTSNRTGQSMFSGGGVSGHLNPGQSVSNTITLTNAGTMAFRYSLSTQGGSGILWSDRTNGLQLEVRRVADGTLLYNGSMAATQDVPLGTMEPGQQTELELRVRLPETAGNQFQSQSMTCDFVWTAVSLL
jgi:hypothetical protein